jgi:hypothetical protein
MGSWETDNLKAFGEFGGANDLHFPLALPKLRIEHLLLTGDPPETEEIPA